MTSKVKRLLYVLIIIGTAGILMGNACEDVADVCDIKCADEGVADGNASITGIASIDSFFAAVVNFDTQATLVADGIDVELAAIADSVGLVGGAGADFSGGFQAALQAKFALEGDISVDFQPPKCEVSAKASIEATAKCDVEVEAGSVEASCEGKCEVDPGEIDLEASCEGEATAEVSCTGTAPNLACEGTCTGSCELEVAASCEGTCTGGCSGECKGECSGSTDSGGVCDGECKGECGGECEGSCELEAGGSCSGSCTGSCEYTPPSAECEAGAKVEVECKAEGSVEPPQVNCSGSCSGEVTPPSASAECEASAKAEAEVKAECHPPSVGVKYNLVASGDATADAEARAEFKAWLTGFKARVGAIAAASAKADKVIVAGEGIIDAAASAIVSAASEIDVEGDIVGTFKLATCLGPALDEVPGIINSATTSLTASVSASASLMGSLGK